MVYKTFFALVASKCIFMFKSSSLCKSEKLVVFFWCRQYQMGPGRNEMYTISGMEKYGHADTPEGGEVYCWYLAVATDFIEFCGYLLIFGSSLRAD